jgi:L-asparaginase II
MSNPVLVEILRGPLVESYHRGALSIFDGDGKSLVAIGDVERPVFPRSAVKIIQALHLIESGAADRFGFGDKELALACASHNGEVEHVALVQNMLAKAGLDANALECGTHWPSDAKASGALSASGSTPNACHNNCSGKHTGFICTAMHQGDDPTGYVKADHVAQERVRDAMAGLTGAVHTNENRGTDGCSIPTYAISLEATAKGMAKIASGQGLSPKRANAAKRLLKACMNEPFFTAGSRRFCTRIMQAAPGHVYAKVGAEGVYCAAVPALGIGIALKIEDGAIRAAEIAVAAAVAAVSRSIPELHGPMAALAQTTDRNWNGIEVGGARSTSAIPSSI